MWGMRVFKLDRCEFFDGCAFEQKRILIKIEAACKTQPREWYAVGFSSLADYPLNREMLCPQSSIMCFINQFLIGLFRELTTSHPFFLYTYFMSNLLLFTLYLLNLTPFANPQLLYPCSSFCFYNSNKWRGSMLYSVPSFHKLLRFCISLVIKAIIKYMELLRSM